MHQHASDCDPPGDLTAAEQNVKRRLTDKVSDAITHAMSQGRTRIAELLSLFQESVVEDEADVASERRADDELKKLVHDFRHSWH